MVEGKPKLDRYKRLNTEFEVNAIKKTFISTQLSKKVHRSRFSYARFENPLFLIFRSAVISIE